MYADMEFLALIQKECCDGVLFTLLVSTVLLNESEVNMIFSSGFGNVSY